MEVLVVAYRFSAENLADLHERFPWVTVVESEGVRGFSENNNLALRIARGKYCFVVNDDTLMSMPVVDRLVADMERLGPRVAAVSPRIVFPDGSLQTCGRAPWTPWRYVRHYLHLVDETKPSKWNPAFVISSEVEKSLFRTYTLNGACFLARTDVFREAGWFDEYYFFTPEDIALGHKFNDMGYEVWADADVTITHIAGGTVSESEPAIKPARVKGALHFYGHRLLLGTFIWCYEALRALKYIGKKGSVNYRTARNVMSCVFTAETPKEVFIRCSK
jgi:GT2 family glycosyltransferase